MQRKKVKFIFSDQPDGYRGAIQVFSHPSWKEWMRFCDLLFDLLLFPASMTTDSHAKQQPVFKLKITAMNLN